MPHTDRTTVLALYIKNLIQTNKVPLGIDNDVLYGDHNNILGGISVIVDSGTKSRSLARVAYPGGGTMNEMVVLVTVYNNKTGSEAVERLRLDQTAEAVENLLHQNTTMGGNIIHGYVHTWQPGIRFKTSSMFRVVEMMFVGQSKTNLANIP